MHLLYNWLLRLDKERQDHYPSPLLGHFGQDILKEREREFKTKRRRGEEEQEEGKGELLCILAIFKLVFYFSLGSKVCDVKIQFILDVIILQKHAIMSQYIDYGWFMVYSLDNQVKSKHSA